MKVEGLLGEGDQQQRVGEKDPQKARMKISLQNPSL